VLGEILLRVWLLVAAVLGFAAYLYPNAFARRRQAKFSRIADMLSGRFLYSDADSARTYGLIVGVVASTLLVLSLFRIGNIMGT
jgi:hypothetical protein